MTAKTKGRNAYGGFFPDLPVEINEIKQLKNGLIEWAKLAQRQIADTDEAPRDLLLNGPIHVIECALVLALASYAQGQGADSDIFRDANELENAMSGHVFQAGAFADMARALLHCYFFERPWTMSATVANRYAGELDEKLREMALGRADEFKQTADRFSKGGTTGRKSQLKLFISQQFWSKKSETSKCLWRQLIATVKENSDADCPLEYDSATEELMETGASGKEYTFKRFEKHMSELRKK